MKTLSVVLFVPFLMIIATLQAEAETLTVVLKEEQIRPNGNRRLLTEAAFGRKLLNMGAASDTKDQTVANKSGFVRTEASTGDKSSDSDDHEADDSNPLYNYGSSSRSSSTESRGAKRYYPCGIRREGNDTPAPCDKGD
ncbi:hypothetical protein CJ030_MR5G017086 [Morella rubra]|uniref:Uncharacterized protein n=1 Tax=Morella rubra TaxID=262757 RepID=A0A6A1VM82_9ROSI|nr:hypothetical protein CJ030_MR5G017086 [Morella rubra]